ADSPILAPPAAGGAGGRTLVARAGESRTLRRLLRNRAAVVALCIIAVLIVVAAFGPLLMPQDPAHQDLLNRLQDPTGGHLLGTDNLGRDNLSRLIEGTRVTLWACLQAIALGVVLGIPTGLMAGFAGRRVDTILNWISDVLLSLPPLILALAIVGILGT